MKELGKLDEFLGSQHSDESPNAIVARLSFLFNAFVITKEGVIVGANDAFLQILKCERDELYGRHALDLVPECERDRLRKILTEDYNEPYQLDVLSCDGGLRHTRVSPKLFYVQNELYRLAEFVDITETYIAEVELRKSEEKFKAIFSHGSVGIARIALDGQWLEVNQKLCEILGYTEPELNSLSFRDVTHPEDLEEDTALIEELLARKRTFYTLEKRYIQKCGKVIWGRLSISLIEASGENSSYLVAFIEDISDRVNLTERLRLSDHIVSASTDMLAILDENGIYLATNEAYANAFGRSLDYFQGNKVVDDIGEDTLNRITQVTQEDLIDREAHSYNAWFDLFEKGKRYLNISYSLISSTGSTYRGIAISARDITSLKLAEMEMRDLNLKLERYSYIDGLTKITNRRMLDKSLKNEWNRALRTQTSLAFIMIDIDFFKSYNDHYGHVKGDECLRRIAKILNRVANRSSDVVARFGGEEFAILVPHATILQATTLAEKCRIAIEEANIPRDFEDAPCCPWITVSIGVSCAYPTKHNSAKKLVKEADSQLYRAKHNGRNCVASTQA